MRCPNNPTRSQGDTTHMKIVLNQIVHAATIPACEGAGISKTTGVLLPLRIFFAAVLAQFLSAIPAQGQQLEMPWEKAAATATPTPAAGTSAGAASGRTVYQVGPTADVEAAAEKDNPAAQNNLAVRLEDGSGGHAKDPKAAVRLYRLAAQQGFALAQFNLGRLYYYGLCGLPEDKIEAAKWYKLSADQGSPGAQNAIGYMIERGEGGFTQSKKEAFKWLKLAADQGFAAAQYGVAGLYQYGEGVKKDLKEARKWYKLAADQGDEDAIKALRKLGSQ